MSDPADQHPLWLGPTPLVLASASATRFKLLTEAGLPVQVILPNVDERAIETPLKARGTAPETIAVSLAIEKALSVSKRTMGRHVIGADQILACDGVQLHKPLDRSSAAQQLAFLSGRTHLLYSATCIALDHQIVASFVGTAKLTMRKLSAQMIERYLDAAGESVLASVGGYQLERTGMHLFSRIGGDHSTILGLPMLQLLDQLRKLGLVSE
ncbi:MAG: Maf family protein [Beijerinckiaceae bacterium]